MHKALAIGWVFLLTLFASSASDIVSGPWILPVAAAACAKPLNLPLWPKPRYDAVPDRARRAGTILSVDRNSVFLREKNSGGHSQS